MGRIVDENYFPIYNDALTDEENEAMNTLIKEDNREFIVSNGEQIDELIRCKDCKHYGEVHKGTCVEVAWIAHLEDFCSRGKKRNR